MTMSGRPKQEALDAFAAEFLEQFSHQEVTASVIAAAAEAATQRFGVVCVAVPYQRGTTGSTWLAIYQLPVVP